MLQDDTKFRFALKVLKLTDRNVVGGCISDSDQSYQLSQDQNTFRIFFMEGNKEKYNSNNNLT